jgi:hypothetical protein
VAVVAAVAVIEPVACGSTVIVTVAEALSARPPIVQVTVGAVIVQLPCDGAIRRCRSSRGRAVSQ